MTDMTNVHTGTQHFPIGGQQSVIGPLSANDERELVQLMFEMIMNDKEIEDTK